MVSFLGPFSLSMCNVIMYCSLSTFLLFLIMTYDETTFRQDERRRRKNEQLVECRNRKRVKEQEKVDQIRKRKKSHLGNARHAGPIGDELSDTVVDVEELDVALIENSTQHALPAFQVGEIVSVEGDTRERG